jgi:cytidine deaminase
MDPVTNYDLIAKAKTVLYHRELYLGNRAGDVACALLTVQGHIFLGVCLDIGSGIGFCAEHSAIAAMITAGETAIARVVAVSWDGKVLPPCGRCRELMYEIDPSNLANTIVILGEEKTVNLSDLLPHPYHEVWGNLPNRLD